MNKKVCVGMFVVVFVLCGLGSCRSTQGAIDTHSPKLSIDWPGTYTGTTPSASGMGIDVRLKLSRDHTYELKYDYVGRPGSGFTTTGSFTWDDAGRVIMLGLADTPSYYKVEENRLIQLDMSGKVIKGKQASMYILRKER